MTINFSYGYHGNVTLMTNMNHMSIILLGITMLTHSDLKIGGSFLISWDQNWTNLNNKRPNYRLQVQ